MRTIKYRYDANRRRYVKPVFTSLGFYLVIFLVLWLICNYVTGIVNIQFFYRVKEIILIIVFFLILIILVRAVVGSVRNKSFIFYVKNLLIRRNLQKQLLKSRVAQKLKEEPSIEIPRVRIVREEEKIKISIPKIAGNYETDLDKLAEDVTSSLPSKFVVTTKKVDLDGKNFIFLCEKIDTDLAFCPQSWEQLCQNDYFLVLQNNLKINLSKTPHLAVWGASGSGKSTVLISILAQLISNTTRVYVIDGKNEFSSFKNFVEEVAVENAEILKLLEEITQIIRKRQKIVAKEVLKTNRIGLTSQDIGLNPVVVMADEVASVLATFDSKDKKKVISYLMQIAQKGRSVGIFLVIASQSPATDVLPNSIREQFATKILLGTASDDIQRMAFGQVATTSEVEKFQGFYMEDGKTVIPQRFYVPNLYAYDLANLETFQKIYDSKKTRS